MFLAILWLLLSGHYNPLLLVLGICSVLLVLYITHRMGVVDQESHPIQINPLSLISYWLWLLKEIFMSNITVSKCVLSPKLPIEPRVITVRAEQRTGLGRVIYANSITLTPGTVTLEISEQEIEVHALMTSTAESLQTGDMSKKVSQISEAI